jgi:hypothetical protein
MTRRGGHGWRGGQGRGTTPGNANTGGRNAQTPFANFARCQGRQGGLPPIGGGGGQHLFVINPFVPAGGPAGGRNAAPMYSNIIKRYANWNAYFCVDLMWKRGIHQKRAPPHGDVSTIRRDSIAQMPVSTSQQGMMHARKLCTKVSCRPVDSVGWRRYMINA